MNERQLMLSIAIVLSAAIVAGVVLGIAVGLHLGRAESAVVVGDLERGVDEAVARLDELEAERFSCGALVVDVCGGL